MRKSFSLFPDSFYGLTYLLLIILIMSYFQMDALAQSKGNRNNEILRVAEELADILPYSGNRRIIIGPIENVTSGVDIIIDAGMMIDLRNMLINFRNGMQNEIIRKSTLQNFEVVDPDRLNRDLEILKLQLSDLYVQENAKRIGNRVQADLLLTGELIISKIDEEVNVYIKVTNIVHGTIVYSSVIALHNPHIPPSNGSSILTLILLFFIMLLGGSYIYRLAKKTNKP
jgi:hypothetical protein